MKLLGTIVRIIGSLLGVLGGLFTISLFFGWDQAAWSQGIPFSVSSGVVIRMQFVAVLLLLLWVWILSRQRGVGSAGTEPQLQEFKEVQIEEDLHRNISDLAYDVDKKIVESHLLLLFDKSATTKTSNYESSVQLALISIVNFLKLSPREGDISASLLRLSSQDGGFDVVTHSGLDRTRVSPKRVGFGLNDSTAGDAIKSADLVRIDDTKKNTQYQWYSGKSRTLWCIPYASTAITSEVGKPKHLLFDHVLCVSSTHPNDLTDEDIRPILMLFAKISLSTLTLYYPIPKRRPRSVKGKKTND